MINLCGFLKQFLLCVCFHNTQSKCHVKKNSSQYIQDELNKNQATKVRENLMGLTFYIHFPFGFTLEATMKIYIKHCKEL